MKSLRLPVLIPVLCFSAVRVAAAAPDYLRSALAHLHSDAPRGWAYTLTTERDGEATVERYDPSRPKGGEWTLMQTSGRAPTARETERYLRYKASNAPVVRRGTFERGDLDLESARLLREDESHGEFRLRFRHDVTEPVLSHVVLDVRVRKNPATAESCVLRLTEPFSPALGMRMHELTVTIGFSPPTAEATALPREVVTRFRGRLFLLIPLSEDLKISYSDFSRVTSAR